VYISKFPDFVVVADFEEDEPAVAFGAFAVYITSLCLGLITVLFHSRPVYLPP